MATENASVIYAIGNLERMETLDGNNFQIGDESPVVCLSSPEAIATILSSSSEPEKILLNTLISSEHNAF